MWSAAFQDQVSLRSTLQMIRNNMNNQNFSDEWEVSDEREAWNTL